VVESIHELISYTIKQFQQMRILVLALLLSYTFLEAQNVPYPHHTQYKSHIKPEVTQSTLDKNTSDFYLKWKQEYLVNGCKTGEYYIDYDNGQTVSEAHGYGMMIFVYMAGFDIDAKKYFDGMYKYFRNHSSGINKDLMSWKQNSRCVNIEGNDSASDGDIDIAFALLLADKQWGSGGLINYKAEAKKVISAIMKAEVNKSIYNVTYGDWVNSSDTKYYNATRSSDFIVDHFRSFDKAFTRSSWLKVVDKCYDIIDDIQTNYSSTTGLMPDFMVNTNGSVKPAPKNHLEGDSDGYYSYNACRFPWRIATDYLISGEYRAKTSLDKLNTWIKTKTNNNPSQIKDGYKLDGTAIATWSDAAFVAPFAVSAMVNSNNQTWLNDIYSELLSTSFSSQGYYENSIQLLSYLVISGNYWTPESAMLTNEVQEFKKVGLYPNPCTDGRLYVSSNYLDFDIEKVEAITMSGKIIPLEYENKSINLSQLSKDVYVINIYTSLNTLFSKTISVE
jgi:endo-1,4-beta-D-glucanase Y